MSCGDCPPSSPSEEESGATAPTGGTASRSSGVVSSGAVEMTADTSVRREGRSSVDRITEAASEGDLEALLAAIGDLPALCWILLVIALLWALSRRKGSS